MPGGAAPLLPKAGAEEPSAPGDVEAQQQRAGEGAGHGDATSYDVATDCSWLCWWEELK